MVLNFGMRKLFPQAWFILTVGQHGFGQINIRLKVNQSGLIPHHNIHAMWIFFTFQTALFRLVKISLDCLSEPFLELTSIKSFFISSVVKRRHKLLE